ncbi:MULTISPECIES: C40 family peptidase [Vitreoscilla]|uniref:NlpC/P60 family protein n=1 Tax=Vitreoscilla stercoraria TaxID=61 RepID=A0ABY4EI77_VITST|nr:MULTISPECIES: NlpC/P60 family protein [Vitreoscilla]AUZ03987.1 NlpC/P60 family protein [Vitreoscilla sp. C1]UOO93087.1 NlpC/P60 family protein [Vitreoscilla stercoraria]
MRILSTAIFLTLALTLSACSSKPKTAPKASQTTSSRAKISIPDHPNTRQEVWFQAFSLVGTPYRYGGSDRNGFDCSGMVQYVYQQATQTALPRTARDIAASSHNISKTQLKSGDLVFFNTGGGTYSHVGIYLGNQEFLHAPSSNGTIRIARLDSPYFAQRFTGARTFMR